MTTPKPDPLAVAERLTGALKTMSERLEQVQKDSIERDAKLGRYGKRNRTYILVDVVLTILLAAFGSLSVHAANQASHANSAQLALCKAGNVARHQQVQLWTHLIGQSRPRTAADARKLAAFRAYVVSDFRPRNCAALGTRKP